MPTGKVENILPLSRPLGYAIKFVDYTSYIRYGCVNIYKYKYFNKCNTIGSSTYFNDKEL
jgi:hypothetical protein